MLATWHLGGLLGHNLRSGLTGRRRGRRLVLDLHHRHSDLGSGVVREVKAHPVLVVIPLDRLEDGLHVPPPSTKYGSHCPEGVKVSLFFPNPRAASPSAC